MENTTLNTTSINATLANILNNNSTAKLKDSKAELDALVPVLAGYKSEVVKTALVTIPKCRTKADLALKLTDLIKALADITTDNEEEKEMIDTEEKLEDLDMIATTIRLELANAQKSFLTVGRCLNEAMDAIKAGGGKQKDFLAWANDHCEIKKAQAYKLMKVYNEFGDESDFAGVSMRVLYCLTGQSEEVVKVAREKAKAGKLESNDLDKIIIALSPKKEEVKVDKVPKAGTPALKGDTKTKKAEVSEDNKAGEVKHIDTESLNENIELKKEIAQLKEEAVKAPTEEADTIAQLKATIAELNKTVETLNNELQATRNEKAKISTMVPVLPQFDSVCKATCIGLELANAGDKVKVNKAYRALAKIYNKDNAPEVAVKILTARTELLAAIA